jgi:hypothetical protein
MQRKKEEAGESTLGEAFIPLEFAPGEAYQFDWSTEVVEMASAMVKVKVAHFVLCHSRRTFSYAYPCETQEMVFDAHVRAFEFYGGVPRRGIYDNMKTAVQKILRGRGREWNPAFERLCAHYRIEPAACNPGSGWEKGRVERRVQIDRERFFSPIPKVNSLGELNERLASQVRMYNRTKAHPTMKEKTIEAVYEEEKGHLLACPTPFMGARCRDVKVSTTCLATFDRNSYSVECQYAGKIVQCKAYADRLVFIYRGKEIARHERHFGRDRTYYHWRHYLPLLIRKPGALRNGAPFVQMELPEELRTVQRHLQEKHASGGKEFVQILSYVARTSMESVQEACRQAITARTISSDVIVNSVLRGQQEPVIGVVEALPDQLVLKHPPRSDCRVYDQLLLEVRR